MKLGKLEKIFINIFTPYDFIDQKKYSPNTKPEYSLIQLRKLYNAKIRCTERLIDEIQRNGKLSEETVQKQKQTPCGYLRLSVANNYAPTSIPTSN